MFDDVSYDEIVKSILQTTTVETSSDLIVCLYEIGKRIDQKMMLMLHPIYQVEKHNWRLYNNTVFAFRKLDLMNVIEVEATRASYVYLIKLIEENIDFFKLNVAGFSENTDIVSKVLKELNDKKDYSI